MSITNAQYIEETLYTRDVNIQSGSKIYGDGSQLTGITASVSGASANGYTRHNAIGQLVATNTLLIPQTSGGMNVDVSTFTGVLKSSTGTFSASAILNADCDANMALNRSKIETATPNYFLVNANSTGVLTETGFIQINSNDVKIQPTANVVFDIANKKIIYDGSNSNVYETCSTLQTTNATATNIITFTPVNNSYSEIYFELISYNTSDNTVYKCKGDFNYSNISNTITLTPILNKKISSSGSMSGCDVSINNNSGTIEIKFTGLLTKTINSTIRCNVIKTA